MRFTLYVIFALDHTDVFVVSIIVEPRLTSSHSGMIITGGILSAPIAIVFGAYIVWSLLNCCKGKSPPSFVLRWRIPVLCE